MMSKKRTTGTIILELLLALLLLNIIVLDSLSANLYNTGFYLNEFEKHDVNVENREELLSELHDFFKGGELASFNEKEILHLHDVRDLLNKGFRIYFFMIGFFAAGLGVYLYHKRDSMIVHRILVIASLLIFAFSALSIMFAKQFTFFFIKFHEILFDNNLWILNPATDILIVLFPEPFFIDYAAAAIARALLLALFMLGTALVLKFRAS